MSHGDVPLELSDLFFNFGHENYEMLHILNTNPSQDEIEDAIRKDATEFLQNYPNTFAGISVDELVADFLRRL